MQLISQKHAVAMQCSFWATKWTWQTCSSNVLVKLRTRKQIWVNICPDPSILWVNWYPEQKSTQWPRESVGLSEKYGLNTPDPMVHHHLFEHCTKMCHGLEVYPTLSDRAPGEIQSAYSLVIWQFAMDNHHFNGSIMYKLAVFHGKLWNYQRVRKECWTNHAYQRQGHLRSHALIGMKGAEADMVLIRENLFRHVPKWIISCRPFLSISIIQISFIMCIHMSYFHTCQSWGTYHMFGQNHMQLTE